MGHKYSTYCLMMRNQMILKFQFQFFATVWQNLWRFLMLFLILSFKIFYLGIAQVTKYCPALLSGSMRKKLLLACLCIKAVKYSLNACKKSGGERLALLLLSHNIKDFGFIELSNFFYSWKRRGNLANTKLSQDTTRNDWFTESKLGKKLK